MHFRARRAYIHTPVPGLPNGNSLQPATPLRTGTGREGRPGSGPHRERERRIAPRPNTTGLQDRPGDPTSVAAVPCAAATGSPTSESLLGSDARRSERHGPSGVLSLAGRNRPRAARRRLTASHTATASTPAAPSPLSLAAARVAHLPAERVGNEGHAPRTTADPSPLSHQELQPLTVVPATASAARVGSTNAKDKLLVPSLRARVRRWRAPGLHPRTRKSRCPYLISQPWLRAEEVRRMSLRGRREALVAALRGLTEDKAARRPAAASGVRGVGERAQQKGR